MDADLDSVLDDVQTPLDTGRSSFFRKIDWASFWTATLVSLLVYFFTLGPSVGLEDSGELAVAGDHLGVPHPPGYPIWSMISWLFARVFSFVTFRGQPTPAWSISLASAVFGALAAGCTSMLITRSAADMLASAHASLRAASKKMEDVLCYVGGVAGSLIFAFSPVMWSQSTIVEVYALGAFFLMLVMLLTYRWMRRPSDKLLWLTAFVFGLGLTNYQVLLLAALPLITIIFFRNIALFRDFVLLCIPFGVGAVLLQTGATPIMPGLLKHAPLVTKVPQGQMLYEPQALVKEILIPNQPCLWTAIGVFIAVVIGVAVLGALRKRGKIAEKSPLPTIVLSIGAVLAFVLLYFAAGNPTGIERLENLENETLAQPVYYAKVAAFVVAAVALSAVASLRKRDWGDPCWSMPLALAALFAVCAFLQTMSYASPDIPERTQQILFDGYTGEPFKFTRFRFIVIIPLLFLLVFSFFIDKAVCFALPVFAVEFTVYLLICNGTMLGLTHPGTWWFWAPAIFNFVILFLSSFALPHGFSVAMTFLAGEIGVSFYAYMPIVSDLRNPPMNWGYPRTWEGFKHAISRGQYEKISPTDIFTPRFVQQIGDFFFDLRKQFTLLIVPFGILPFAAWRTGNDKDSKINVKFFLTSIGLLVAAALIWGADNWIGGDTASKFGAAFNICGVIFLVASIVFAFMAGFQSLHIGLFFVGLAIVFVLLGNWHSIEKVFDDSRIDILAILGLSLLCFVGAAMLSFGQLLDSAKRAYKSKDISQQVTTFLVIAAVALFTFAICFKTIDAIAFHYLVADGWNPKLCTIASAALALAITGAATGFMRSLSSRQRVRNGLDNISRQWLIGTILNFLVMSVLLVVLANPKGDLQDTFIQKVKFISSHGLFALWLGYGFIFAIVTVNSLARRFLLKPVEGDVSANGANAAEPKSILPAALTCAAIVAAALTPFIPIRENYFNKRLVFELGSAEQNGHDYGWQFGNYQLRGADAITEELEADEEPLPNPSYPPEMGPGAVFYGGTDPGRFVPTYMIYSANVRPDVFLITQNALADNTFMATTRALYGDDLWIPTPEDSANAFQIYVKEVNEGKRPRNADLEITGGRVQVTGALGVMEINGILAKMIFERNKPWHKFYVEESYVIPWMYPYLTPHGLIMHINNETTQLTRENTNDDLDFWDWYVRRLTRDDRYRRDLVAQKSFSKLRSALAGLYGARNKIRESERAYMESRLLYPVSPEANFRMVQDIYLRQGRFNEARLAVEEFCRQDVNSERGPQFLAYINGMVENQKLIAEFGNGQMNGAPLDPATAIRVARAYISFGNDYNAAEILRKIAAMPGLTVAVACDAAMAMQEANASTDAAALFNRLITTKFVQQSRPALLSAFQAFSATGDVNGMRKAATGCLKLKQNDWEMWARLAVIDIALGNRENAYTEILNAQKLGGYQFSSFVEKEPMLLQFIKEINERASALKPANDLTKGFQFQ